MNNVDPDGEVALLVTGGVGAIIGGVVGGGLEAYKQAQAGNGFNAGKIGLQAGKGALVGLAVGLTGGAAGAVVELTGATGAGAAATVALPSAAVGATGTALVSATNDIDAGLPASEVSDNSVKAFATGGAGALAGGAASPTIGNAIKNMSGFGGVGNVNGAGAVVGEASANIVSTVVTESANALPEPDIEKEN
ncbi:MAG: hypothetical protein HC850_16165 [Rhodomicrobium sp.]|nr:hypothetical protein [Rhodomicrobium sp.]